MRYCNSTEGSISSGVGVRNVVWDPVSGNPCTSILY